MIDPDTLQALCSRLVEPWRERAEEAEAELARIKAHGGNCGECDGWHGCCDAASRVRALCDRAEAAPNPYADQGAVAQVDVRDVRAALDGPTCRTTVGGHASGIPMPCVLPEGHGGGHALDGPTTP